MLTSSVAVSVADGDEGAGVHTVLSESVVDLLKIGRFHPLGPSQDPGELCQLYTEVEQQ